EQFHRDEERAALFADFIDLADVWMVDARRRTRLTPEAAPRRLVVVDGQHHLQRDGPLEPGVLCLVHDAHAAGAKLPANRVMADVRRRGVRRFVAPRRRLRGPLQPITQAAQPSGVSASGGIIHDSRESYPSLEHIIAAMDLNLSAEETRFRDDLRAW